jgi:hypothetical protein
VRNCIHSDECARNTLHNFVGEARSGTPLPNARAVRPSHVDNDDSALTGWMYVTRPSPA